LAAEKPIIRIAVPGETAEEFMQAAAKQFRGDFFVAIDQPVGKFVRVEAPFLQGGVAVRGDAIAMPAVRNGRKGLVIRLVKLDSDSLGIPIPEMKQDEEPADDEDDAEAAAQEFDPAPTMASPVSAQVAMSIKQSTGATAAVRSPAPKPEPDLDELDDDAREAVNEFASVATKASDLSADLAKQLADAPPASPVATHAVRRPTPDGSPKQEKPTVEMTPLISDEAKGDVTDRKPEAEAAEAKPEPEAAPKERAVSNQPAASSSRTLILLVLLLLAAIGAAAVYFLK
jgi:hypothetical protein